MQNLKAQGWGTERARLGSGRSWGRTHDTLRQVAQAALAPVWVGRSLETVAVNCCGECPQAFPDPRAGRQRVPRFPLYTAQRVTQPARGRHGR